MRSDSGLVGVKRVGHFTQRITVNYVHHKYGALHGGQLLHEGQNVISRNLVDNRVGNGYVGHRTRQARLVGNGIELVVFAVVADGRIHHDSAQPGFER